MNIVHLAATNTAYCPAQLVYLTNQYTEHRAFLIQEREFIFGNPLEVYNIQNKDEISAVLAKADVLHFHGPTIFDKKQTQGIILPQQGKQVVLHYHGTPQREHAAKYRRQGVPLLLSTPEMLPLFPQSTYFPNLIDESHPMYVSLPSQNGVLRLAHHFSLHQGLKDTDLFRQAQAHFSARYLKNGHRIEFVWLERMPLLAALRQRAECQAIFDHCQGYYGLISLEGMAQGICIVNGCTQETLQALAGFLGAVPPFFLTTRQTFLTDLARLGERALELGQAGREFVKKYWSGKHLIQRLIEFYKGI